MSILEAPIGYLENSDIDSQGNITNKQLLDSNLPILVMIQANYCGHCTHSKPAFQEFASMNEGKVICLTIQGDSTNPTEKELASRVKDFLPNFKGYPTYVLYKNGRIAKPDLTTDRSVNGLAKFVFG